MLTLLQYSSVNFDGDGFCLLGKVKSNLTGRGINAASRDGALDGIECRGNISVKRHKVSDGHSFAGSDIAALELEPDTFVVMSRIIQPKSATACRNIGEVAATVPAYPLVNRHNGIIV